MKAGLDLTGSGNTEDERIDIIKAYEKVADSFRYGNWSWISKRALERMKAYCNDFNMLRVIDLGCGSGGFPRSLNEDVGAYCGIDITPQMIQESSEATKWMKNANLINGDYKRTSDERLKKYLNNNNVVLDIAPGDGKSLPEEIFYSTRYAEEGALFIGLFYTKGSSNYSKNQAGLTSLINDLMRGPLRVFLHDINLVEFVQKSASFAKLLLNKEFGLREEMLDLPSSDEVIAFAKHMGGEFISIYSVFNVVYITFEVNHTRIDEYLAPYLNKEMES